MSNNIVLSRLFNVLRDIKTTLNSSIAAKASTADLEQHAQDSTAHVTAAERTAWNGKAGASHTHSSADISDLQQRLDGIMADLVIMLEPYDTAITRIDNDVESLADRTNIVETNVTDLSSRVSTNTSNITTINSTLSNLSDSVTENTSDISSLSTRVGSAEDTLTDHGADITALQTALDELQATLNTLANNPNLPAELTDEQVDEAMSVLLPENNE